MPNSLVPSPEIRPTIRWSYKDGDVGYRVYHREMPSGAETMIGEVTPDEAEQPQEFAVMEPLNGVDGVWHEFRVEALNSDYVESTRAVWHALVRDQPEGPSEIEIEEELAGTFKLTLTA